MDDVQDIAKATRDDGVSVFSACASALLIVGIESSRIITANAAAERLLPNCRPEAPLSDWLSLSVEDTADLLRRSLADGYLDFRDHHAPVPAGRRKLHLHGGGIDWADRNCFLIMVQEVTAPEVPDTAPRDLLTGLPNRALFRDRLEQALARAGRADEQFAVLYLDLDRFEDVDRSLGREVANALLCLFAERLRSFVRATDTVARFGGDEFGVLVTGLQDPAHSAILAQKVLRFLASPFSIGGEEVRVTASIGVSLFHGELNEADDYLDRAKRALRTAKQEGRNTYRFHTETLDELLRSEVAIGTDLHHALEEEELTVVYQPQIDIVTNQIVGLEALARWSHHRRGQVPPTEFISVAERTNLIVPLGNWVFHQACMQARAWLDEGLLPDVMAVNLSPLQFKDADLVAHVRSALGESGVPAERIELEITENIVMEAMGGYHATLARLRSDGIRFAIDDFGTGYSSLKYLRSFPAHKLKIAQEFLTGVPEDRNDTAIVRATIDLAKDMDLTVIAEGAEKAAQVEFLRALRCDQVQGYYFSRPLSPADATAFLKAHL